MAMLDILAVPAQPSRYLFVATVTAGVSFFLWIAYIYFKLAHIPGPFLARFTDVIRLSWVVSYKAHDIHVAQHRKHGSLVRFGPNMVSVADPAEVGTIYGFSKPWLKVSKTKNMGYPGLICSVRFLSCSFDEVTRERYAGYICNAR